MPPVNFEICQKAFNKLNSIGTLARSLCLLLAPFGWFLPAPACCCLHGWQANKHGTWQATGLHFTFHLSRVSQKGAHTDTVAERQGPRLHSSDGAHRSHHKIGHHKSRKRSCWRGDGIPTPAPAPPPEGSRRVWRNYCSAY